MTEDLISHRAVYEHFRDAPVPLTTLSDDILRWQGLDPARYRLEAVPDLYAWRIVRRPETP